MRDFVNCPVGITKDAGTPVFALKNHDFSMYELPEMRTFHQPWLAGITAAIWLSYLLCSFVLDVDAEVLYWPLNGIELARQRAATVSCVNHLAQITRAARQWSMDHSDQPPANLQVLTNDLESAAVLFCPADLPSETPTNWAQVVWNQIDYEWMPLTPAEWLNPTNIACRCRIHTNVGLVDGTVLTGGYRPGWPYITAAPLEATATPGEVIRFEVKVSCNALQPLHSATTGDLQYIDAEHHGRRFYRLRVR